MKKLDLLTAEQAAPIIHIKPRVIIDKKRHEAGFPRPYKPGKQYLWDRKDLEKWLETTRD